METRLFYICHNSGEADYDTVVEATSAQEAVMEWRAAHDFDPEEAPVFPQRVYLIPPLAGKLRVLDWARKDHMELVLLNGEPPAHNF